MIINDYIANPCIYYVFSMILGCFLSTYKNKFAVKQYAVLGGQQLHTAHGELLVFTMSLDGIIFSCP